MAHSYVKDCHDMREAQVLQNSDERLSYTYMGGGVTWQPPNTYAMVTRDLPLHVADRFMAMLACVANVEPCNNMFVRKQNANVSRRLHITEKEEQIKIRIAAVAQHIVETRRIFTNRATMIRDLLHAKSVQSSVTCQVAETRPATETCSSWEFPVSSCQVCSMWDFSISPCPLCKLAAAGY